MPLDPTKGYRLLLKGRHSQVGAEYFITFCTEDRQVGLETETVASRILAELDHMELNGVWVARCAVVMPDHVHLLVQLGEKLSLGKAVARLKSRSSLLLKGIGVRWQPGFHEHRLRPQENRLPLFLYIYLNPYRARLVPTDASWPWFVCGDRDREWFLPMLNKGLPEPAWLSELP
jgi:putative transposase